MSREPLCVILAVDDTELLIAIMLSKAKRPPQTRMLSAMRTASSGRIDMLLRFLPDLSVDRSDRIGLLPGISLEHAAPASLGRGKSRTEPFSSPVRGRGRYCWRF